jgi:hypothetical protein
MGYSEIVIGIDAMTSGNGYNTFATMITKEKIKSIGELKAEMWRNSLDFKHMHSTLVESAVGYLYFKPLHGDVLKAKWDEAFEDVQESIHNEK